MTASASPSTVPDRDLVSALHRHVIDHISSDPRATVDSLAAHAAPLMPDAARRNLVNEVLAHVHGLGPLEGLLGDDEITDVLVNQGNEVWIERRGRLARVATLRPGVAELLIERILAPLGLRADRTSPIVDARLPDGSRVHAVIPPLAVDGPSLAIRRFAAHRIPLSDMVLAAPVADLLRQLVRHRCNIVVSGATSAGKTTLLNALAGQIPASERVITIEDAAELRLDAEHVVRLEARPASSDGLGAASVRDLVRAALRMRPDRLVIGEVRGAEAFDMVQAMNTGHDGSLTTCHANSAPDALRRIESMILLGAPGWPLTAVREQIHASLDVVVHVVRGEAGRRRVAEVVEVTPAHDGERVRVLARRGQVITDLRRSRRTAK
jgi:pilus assembly protein CpaF